MLKQLLSRGGGGVLPLQLLVLVFASGVVLELPVTAMILYLTKDLKVTPANVALYYGTVFTPYFFKIAFGFVSDRVAILGYRRKAWVVVLSFGALVCMLSLATLVRSFETLLWVSTTRQTFLAWNEIIMDAIVVEHVALHAGSAAAAQSTVYSVRYSASLVANSISIAMFACGASPKAVFLVCTCLSICVPISALRIVETRGSPALVSWVAITDAGGPRTHAILREALATIKHIVQLIWFVERPIWPILLFVFVTQSMPLGSAVSSSYLYDQIELSNWQANLQTCLAVAASLLVSATYRVVGTRWPLGRVFIIATIIAAVGSLSRVALVAGFYTQTLGMSGVAAAIIDACITSATTAVAFIPMVVLATLACPPGAEALAFACILSVNDGASSLSDVIESGLATAFGITYTDFSRAPWLELVCSLLKPLSLVALYLPYRFHFKAALTQPDPRMPHPHHVAAATMDAPYTELSMS